MKCELCKDKSCVDLPDGRIITYDNGKDSFTEEDLTFVAGCQIRQKHEQKELLKHLHKVRQNLIP